MKRYKFIYQMIEDDKGQWVKLSDANEAIKAENEACAILMEDIETYAIDSVRRIATRGSHAIRARGE